MVKMIRKKPPTPFPLPGIGTSIAKEVTLKVLKQSFVLKLSSNIIIFAALRKNQLLKNWTSRENFFSGLLKLELRSKGIEIKE